MKKIIVYYSFEGNTKLVSETMARKIGSNLFEIKPEKEIRSKGFMKFVWGGRQAVMGKKPPLKDTPTNIDSYDLIIIGTPVWAGRPAPPVKAFMEDHLPEGRNLALFYTYEGGEGKTLEIMEKMSNNGNIISKTGFMAPLKGDREGILKEARKWASNL